MPQYKPSLVVVLLLSFILFKSNYYKLQKEHNYVIRNLKKEGKDKVYLTPRLLNTFYNIIP